MTQTRNSHEILQEIWDSGVGLDPACVGIAMGKRWDDRSFQRRFEQVKGKAYTWNKRQKKPLGSPDFPKDSTTTESWFSGTSTRAVQPRYRKSLLLVFFGDDHESHQMARDLQAAWKRESVRSSGRVVASVTPTEAAAAPAAPLFIDCILNDYPPAKPALVVSLHYQPHIDRLEIAEGSPRLTVKVHLAKVQLWADFASVDWVRGSIHVSDKASFNRSWSVKLPSGANAPVLDQLPLVRLKPRSDDTTMRVEIRAMLHDMEPELVGYRDAGLNEKDARVLERVLAKHGFADEKAEVVLDTKELRVPGTGQ